MSSVKDLKKEIIEKAWEDSSFKAKLLSDPKSAIMEAFNIKIPDSFKLTAVQESQSEFYLVVPAGPAVSTIDVKPNSTWM